MTNLILAFVTRYAYVTYPTVSGRICGSPEVAEFHIRPGVEHILCLKSTLSHFGRSSGGALWTSRPAPVSTLTGLESGEAHSTYGRAPSEFRSTINRSVDARPTPGQHSADTRAGSAQQPACVLRCAWMLRDVEDNIPGGP